MRHGAPATPSSNKSASATRSPLSAIEFFKADRQKINAMFGKYGGLGHRAMAAKRKAAREICLKRTKRAVADEETLHSDAREAVGDRNMVDEATVERACAKDLIGQTFSMEPSEDLHNATVKVLGERIERHVEKEVNEMFPTAREAKLDMAELGSTIQARKDEIGSPLPY